MIKTQIKLLLTKYNLYIAGAVCTALSIIYFIKAPDSPVGMVSREYLYIGNGYTKGFSIFSVLYPFLVVIPFGMSYIDDITKKTYAPVVIRGDKKGYVAGKLIAAFIGNFLIVFIPFILNLVLTFMFYNENSKTPFGERTLGNLDGFLYGTNLNYNTPANNTLFADMFFSNPFLYYFLYLVMLASVTGLLGAFVVSISMWLKRYKILLFIPVYVLMRIASTYTDISLQKAVSNPNHLFINYNILDYVTPFNMISGCYYPVFIGMILFILLFVVVTAVHTINKETV